MSNISLSEGSEGLYVSLPQCDSCGEEYAIGVEFKIHASIAGTYIEICKDCINKAKEILE